MDLANIGEFLRKNRKAKGHTQGYVADQLGVSAQAVSKWERGENLPDVAFLPDISKILGVGVDEILHAGMAATDRPHDKSEGIGLLAENSFEEILEEVKKTRRFQDLDIDLDFFVYLTGAQKSRLVTAILTKKDYSLALDDLLPYCNTAHRSLIISHILENQDYDLLENIATYMSNEMKTEALTQLLNQGRYDIIEDNMPAFNRKHRDIIVDFIVSSENELDEEIIENFIPFFDINQRDRLKESLYKEEDI